MKYSEPSFDKFAINDLYFMEKALGSRHQAIGHRASFRECVRLIGLMIILTYLICIWIQPKLELPKTGWMPCGSIAHFSGGQGSCYIRIEGAR